MTAEMCGAGAPQGLSWSWELDFDALMDSLGEAGPRRAGTSSAAPAGTSSSAVPAGDHAGGPVPASPATTGGSPSDGPSDVGPIAGEAVLDDLEDRADVDDAGQRGERIPAGVLAGRVAERLGPGPDLVGWLAMAPAADLGDADLAVVAGSWRRVASWAQAQELAAVAQIVSRAAARDEDVGTGADGRPARVPVSAAAEVALELTMSQYAASWWADLAVDLGWRLAATREALAAGVIDLSRARLIAEETRMLSDAAARAVEQRVLASAGSMTTGSLRAALRRAVIAADPQGAERRRKEAERQAKVSLYPDQESTATLAGQRLPGVHAAAAMARIKAMARAWKASGAPGGMDLLSAKVYLGLLLGTLPLIPPAEGAPPDDPPGPPGPPEDGPGAGPGEDPPGGGSSGAGLAGSRGSGGDDGRGAAPGGDRPSGGGHRGGRPRGSSGGSPGGDPGEGPGRGRRRGGPGGGGPGDPARGGRNEAGPGNGPSRDSRPADAPGSGPAPGGGQDGGRPDSGPGGMPADDVPPPGDQDAPRDDDPYLDDGPSGGGASAGGADGPGQDDDDGAWPGCGPGPDWPGLPAVIPPAFARPGSGQPGDGRPAAGLLDVSVPWQVLAGTGAGPGCLGRIGPVTGLQARSLAGCAARDPAAEWRIIVTTPAGHALAVTRLRRPRGRDGPPRPGGRPGTGAGIGLVGRVTLTIPDDLLGHPPPPASPAGPGPPGGILAAALAAATAAAARARAAAAADTAAGGCTHQGASPGYRPPPRLREYVTARDLTCRSPICRQPAWRGDLDHTIPFDDGGLTCRCNLGGLCRTHHILKHHPDWKLEQTAPGAFTWTTPSGRTFTITPDTHLL